MSKYTWFSYGDLPPMGTGSVEVDWAFQALTQGFMKGDLDRPVYNNVCNGVLKGATFAEIEQKFRDLGMDVLLASPPMKDGDNSNFVQLVSPLGAMWLNGSGDEISARIVTADKEEYDAFVEIMNTYSGPRVSSGKAFVLVAGRDKLVLKSIGLAAAELERGNYNPDVLEDYDHIVSDMHSSDPTGRLSILDGPPGTGKTYMIRGLMHDVPDALFIFTPVSLIPSLANPNMIGTLIDTKRSSGDAPMVFIVEDADTTLAKRGVDNLESISALLNLGDGILGAMLDIRVVCTTNLKDAEMDDAVIRPGRLSRKIHIGYLNAPVAEDLYFRLTGKKERIRERMTVAQVYSMAKDKGWKPPVKPKRTVGFAGSNITDALINSED